MKKIISCILILTLALSLLAACSGGSEDGTSTGAPVDNAGSTGETWETLKYGSYLSDVRTFFETNLKGAVINNQGEGVFSVEAADGATICEVRGWFNSALEKGDENLTVDYTYTGGLTDDTAKIEAALGFCGAIAAPYIAGLTGSRVAPADIVNAIRDKTQAGTYETFTRGDSGRAITIKTAGIPVAIFLYNDYDARLCVGSTPIEQHRLSLGMKPSSAAADDAAEKDAVSSSGADEVPYSGTDAETFAALAVRYFKKDLENDVRIVISSDKKKIRFYDAAVTDPDDYFMWVSLDSADDISDGIGAYFNNDLASEFIARGEVNNVIIMLTTCAASYLSLTEGKNVTMDEVVTLIGQNVEQGTSVTSSYFKYGKSHVSTSVTNMPRLGWSVNIVCAPNT